MKKYKKVTIIFLLIVMTEIISSYTSEIIINKIRRNKYSEGAYEKSIILEIDGKKYEKNFYINTLREDSEDKVLKVYNLLKLDERVVNGEIYGYSDVEISWDEDEKNIYATIKCELASIKKKFHKKMPEVSENLIKDIRNKLNEKSDRNSEELPKIINGKSLKWIVKKENIHLKVFELFLIGLIGLNAYKNVKKNKFKLEEKEHMKNVLENKIMEIGILYSIGESKNNIFNKLVFESKEVNEKFDKYRKNIEANQNINKELLCFAEEIGSKNFKEFLSLIIKYDFTGSNGFELEFKRLVEDIWKKERYRLREEIEKRTVQIIFPMFMIFISILIIVMSPAILSF
ncbi:MAG: hypothetical protein N4A47_05425 [Clostridia bacterium]|jgi:hypothetical protein|nr:hypothetical protein [Clostridia bacterium]